MYIFDVLTIFPDIFTNVFSTSILKIAQDKGLLKINIINLRDFTKDKHKSVDDSPYGGGSGMVMMAEPLARAIIARKKDDSSLVINFSAKGKLLNFQTLNEIHNQNNCHIILICGHYEGIDQRFIDKYVDLEISIGDYILTGGEIPAMTFIDSFTRLIPGVLGNENSLKEESFTKDLLEYPQYTRPDIFDGEKVPSVLLSGNHKKIRLWRLYKSLLETKNKRPDLFNKFLNRNDLSLEEKKMAMRIAEII